MRKFRVTKEELGTIRTEMFIEAKTPGDAEVKFNEVLSIFPNKYSNEFTKFKSRGDSVIDIKLIEK